MYTESLELKFWLFMFQSLVIVELVSGSENLITQVTGIAETIWVVLRLHMVPCAGNHSVGEPVTQGTVEPLVTGILPHKLEEVTWLLKLAT